MNISILPRFFRQREKTRLLPAPRGYDLWAPTYDLQPNNAVLELESRLFRELVSRVSLDGKAIADIGCGTGRHWAELYDGRPSRLIGIDPSRNMLQRMKQRHAVADLICGRGDALLPIADGSCDVIISTLAFAHIRDASSALAEWHRVLPETGEILLTDFHPDAARAGMKRTFVASGKVIEIEQYPTGLDELSQLASDRGFEVRFRAERAIDESVRHLFEAVHSIDKYDRHRGLPLVYGMHLVKT